MPVAAKASFSIALAVFASGCGGVYQLPAPPPTEERGPVALDPSEEERLSGERYLAARRVIVALYSALEAQRWDEATELLSQETRLLLAAGGIGSDVDALAAGRVSIDGRTYAFDPVELFLLPGADSFEDRVEGEEEHESGRRKEVFLVADETLRKVVLIDEGGAWRLHMRRWPMEYLQREAS